MRLESNPLCGTFGEGTSETVATITCAYPMDGRYLTLQKTNADYSYIDEIYTCELISGL